MNENDVMATSFLMKRLFERRSKALLEAYQLRMIELDILLFLSHSQGAPTATDIIKAKHISKAHVSKSIERLHRQGYVTLYEDEGDRRILRIQLLPQADEVVAQADQIRSECKDAMLRDVTEEELACLGAVLGKIARNIDDALKAG
ncbi:MAG: MarR family transcriptional regulator [Clostridiales bacterium]|nr:MarR family transcriptional regulator [Clostridiales bacterium]